MYIKATDILSRNNMRFLTPKDFEELYDVEEGSQLFDNLNYKLLQTDDEECYWVPNSDANMVKYLNSQILHLDFFKDKSLRRTIDIGAMVGKTTVELSKISEVVESFDCNPRSVKLLKANAENAWHNNNNITINPYHYAITDSDKYCIETIDDLGDYAQSCISTPALGTEKMGSEVEYTLTKQHRLDHFGFTDVDLIYIDVNGFELRVLLGAAETIKKNAPYIYVNPFNDKLSLYNSTTNEILDLLSKNGYSQIENNLYGISK